MEYKVIGDDMQGLLLFLDPGESIISEAGNMFLMSDGITMETNMKGGAWSSFKRSLSGESFFMSDFTNHSQSPQEVGLAGPHPGRILPIELSEYSHEFLCQKDAFLCADPNTEISMAFTKKLSAGFFGGESLILQKISGDGRAFIHLGGAEVAMTLEPGQSLRVDTGCIVGFESSVEYSVEFVKGIKNMFFGGEGMFLAKLSGPGKVILQTLPFSKLAGAMGAKIARARDDKDDSFVQKAGSSAGSTAVSLAAKLLLSSISKK